jgi:hypothetical protein
MILPRSLKNIGTSIYYSNIRSSGITKPEGEGYDGK